MSGRHLHPAPGGAWRSSTPDAARQALQNAPQARLGHDGMGKAHPSVICREKAARAPPRFELRDLPQSVGRSALASEFRGRNWQLQHGFHIRQMNGARESGRWSRDISRQPYSCMTRRNGTFLTSIARLPHHPGIWFRRLTAWYLSYRRYCPNDSTMTNHTNCRTTSWVFRRARRGIRVPEQSHMTGQVLRSRASPCAADRRKKAARLAPGGL
jgi:hypothetical protein